MSTERVALLHVGTHKTATTSLQLFFEQNKAALRTAGVYFPDSGRYNNMPGHHLLAWDMLAHAKSNSFDDLLEELQRADALTALLTSEDFSLLHARPDALEVMASGLRGAGYKPVVVVYLRPQAAFAESMYAERVKHDYIRPLDGYLRTIRETGSYKPDGTLIHLVFRYTELLEPFVRVFGKENVIVRPYEAQQGVAHVFQDFVAVLRALSPAFGKTALSLAVHTPRANDSLTFLGLLYTAYTKLHGENGSPQETANAIARMIYEAEPAFPKEYLSARFALITRDETLSFLEAFAPDNRRIAEEYGVEIAFRSASDVPAESEPIWKRAFAHRKLYDSLLSRWLTPKQ